MHKIFYTVEISLIIVILLLTNIFEVLPLSDTWYLCLMCLVFSLIRRTGWKEIGLAEKTQWKRTILIAFVAALFLQLLGEVVIGPLVKFITHKKQDLDDFKALVGDRKVLVYYLSIIWTQVAFGEEIAFRGYFMGRVADVFNRSKFGWIVALITVSIAFGFAHYYKGAAGIIDSSISGLFLGLLYLLNRKDLWVCILAHAFSDTIACLLIYFKLIAL